MAFLDSRNNNKGKKDKIKLKFSIDNSLRFIIYSVAGYPSVKRKNITNLYRLLEMIDEDLSFEESDVMAKYYFKLLKIISAMAVKEEISTVDVLYDTLMTNHGEKDIPKQVIESVVNDINSAVERSFDPNIPNEEQYLTQAEIEQMRKFVEDRLTYSFFIKSADKFKDISIKLVESRVSDSEIIKSSVDLVNNLYSEIIKVDTTMDKEDHEINFTDRDTSENIILRSIQRAKSPNNHLKTGYKALNRMLNGGLQEDRLYIFFGTPKSFKSGVLLNVALSVTEHNKISHEKAKGRKPVVVYFTMENDITETLNRIYYYYYGKGIGEEDLDNNTILERIYDKLDGNKTGIGLKILYAASNTVTTDYIYDIIHKLREEGCEPILMIQDYLRRIRPAKQEAENRLAMGNITDEFSIIAKKFNIPFVTAGQLNREATNIREESIKNRNPDIASRLFASHIAESVQIQQNLDYGIIVCREEITNYDNYGDAYTDSFIAFREISSREERKKDDRGNVLDYFALKFENGFKIEQDEGTEEERYYETVARASMTKEQYAEFERRKDDFAKKINNDYQNKINDHRRPVQATPVTNRVAIGNSTLNMNKNILDQKIKSVRTIEDDL